MKESGYSPVPTRWTSRGRVQGVPEVAWFAIKMRKSGLVEVPDAAEFALGERVYFRLIGCAIHITRTPAVWSDGRYRSARVRRTSKSALSHVIVNMVRPQRAGVSVVCIRSAD